MNHEERLSRKITKFLSVIVAILGLIFGIISIYPIKVDIENILIITAIIFFSGLITLITLYISQLEEKINKLEETINNERRIGKIENEIKRIKEKQNG